MQVQDQGQIQVQDQGQIQVQDQGQIQAQNQWQTQAQYQTPAEDQMQTQVEAKEQMKMQAQAQAQVQVQAQPRPAWRTRPMLNPSSSKITATVLSILYLSAILTVMTSTPFSTGKATALKPVNIPMVNYLKNTQMTAIQYSVFYTPTVL